MCDLEAVPPAGTDAWNVEYSHPTLYLTHTDTPYPVLVHALVQTYRRVASEEFFIVYLGVSRLFVFLTVLVVQSVPAPTPVI